MLQGVTLPAFIEALRESTSNVPQHLARGPEQDCVHVHYAGSLMATSASANFC
jgi:hypothetical protein